MKKLLVVLLTCVLAMVAFAGCGSDDASEATDPIAADWTICAFVDGDGTVLPVTKEESTQLSAMSIQADGTLDVTLEGASYTGTWTPWDQAAKDEFVAKGGTIASYEHPYNMVIDGDNIIAWMDTEDFTTLLMDFNDRDLGIVYVKNSDIPEDWDSMF